MQNQFSNHVRGMSTRKRSENMRELKFRVWDKDAKRMLYQTDIEYYDDMIGFRFDSDILANKEDIVIMQYTVLKDKNGKEAYEGDVVKLGDQYLVVKYRTEYACFELSVNDDVYKRIFVLKDAEIVGNIYENPELLEVAR